MYRKRLLSFIPLILMGSTCHAQQFRLEKKTDSLYILVLTTDSTRDEWRLPYPVYRFCTGDVNGDGSIDAIVGVVKRTRFYKDLGTLCFFLKKNGGYVRPLGRGFNLSELLQNFGFKDAKLAVLRPTAAGK